MSLKCDCKYYTDMIEITKDIKLFQKTSRSQMLQPNLLHQIQFKHMDQKSY